MLLKRLEQWDQASFYRLFNRSSSRLIFNMSFWLSKTADGPLYLLLSAALLAAEISAAQAFSKLLICSFAIELPLYLLLKNSIKRARPADVLAAFTHAHIVPSDRFSLPSGHTAGAFVLATAVAIYFPHLLLLAIGWAFSIGLCRILLGVHFPFDVIAGAILGTACALCSYILYI
jgi:undecaprenyl-diphosphatase